MTAIPVKYGALWFAACKPCDWTPVSQTGFGEAKRRAELHNKTKHNPMKENNK